MENACLVLKGTHGTSKTRANSILKESKFKASTDGRVGPGVYFWAYEDNMSFAKCLAENWWFSANHKFGTFKGDDDPSPAVLKAQIEVNKNVYFDTSSEEFLELLIKTAKCKNIPRTSDDFNNLRIVILKELEAIKNLSFDVLKAEVDVPGAVKKMENTPYAYFIKKQASTYVVMPHATECIRNIESVEV